jgi:adenylate cyclase
MLWRGAGRCEKVAFARRSGENRVTSSLALGWAGLVRRGPSIARRLRLASGLVLFSYVFLHFLNHSLGNIGYEAMEWGAQYAEMIWRGPVGGPLLYGAFAIHFALALWALYIRRHLRMGWLEGLRLLLGFSIPLLIVSHAVQQRLAYTLFDTHRVYRGLLYNYFYANPHLGVRQLIVFTIAWLHGCLVIHLWLRVKPHYRKVAPVLLALAVLVPTMALLGIYQGARQVIEKAQLDPAWITVARKAGRGGEPVVAGTLQDIIYWLWAGFAAALVLVLIARGVRTLIERRRGAIRVIYPDGRSVRIPKGLSVLDASRRAGIPHASLCGGRARCSTCRVRVLLGLERLPPMAPVETRVLARLGADRAVRLACQLKPVADISVWPLLPPETTMGDQRLLNVTDAGTEHFVAILFVDIRRSTELVESRLPFDVVFILNRFFEAVGSAITAAGGMPNQFIGDGVMAIFGAESDAEQACGQALEAARLIDWHVGEMNHALASELQQPLEVGIGIHGGEVIIGTLGYREHATMTAIGETVHIASRLQDLTKEYDCQLVVSDIVGTTAGIALDGFPRREVQVRGLRAPLAVRVIDNAAALGGDKFRALPVDANHADAASPTLAQIK